MVRSPGRTAVEVRLEQKEGEVAPRVRPRLRAFHYYGPLRRAREYVEQHLGDSDLDLRRVAAVAGQHPKYFSTYFHEKTGVHFRKWLNALRIERAQDALRAGDESITEIAWDVGYGNLRTFQRAFRQYTEMSAREYRNLVRPERE